MVGEHSQNRISRKGVAPPAWLLTRPMSIRELVSFGSAEIGFKLRPRSLDLILAAALSEGPYGRAVGAVRGLTLRPPELLDDLIGDPEPVSPPIGFRRSVIGPA